MLTTLFSLSLILLIARSVLAQSSISIPTPVLVQCQPAHINWTDTCSGPYELLVASADDMCGNALEDLGYQNSTSITWDVTLASGTQVVLYVEDAEGNDAWSETIIVGGSNDTSCLKNTTSSGVSGSPTSSPATPSSPVPSSPAVVNAGLSSNSGMLSTRPVSAVALLGTGVLTAVVLAL